MTTRYKRLYSKAFIEASNELYETARVLRKRLLACGLRRRSVDNIIFCAAADTYDYAIRNFITKGNATRS